MNYALAFIVGLLGMVCVALTFITVWALCNANRRAMQAWERQVEAEQVENKRLNLEATLNLCYADGLEQENKRLNAYADQVFALNADLHDKLLGQAERYKALERQTVEIPSASAKIPPRPKRTAKKKVEAST